MSVYIVRSDGAYAQFDGMSGAQIQEMLADQGMTCSFIDEATYLACISKQH